MKIRNILLNWSYEDEELLEPYEWQEDDDLEVLKEAELFKVSKKTLFDLIYNQIKVTNLNLTFDTIYAFSDGSHCVVIEFDETKQIFARSLVSFQERLHIEKLIPKLYEIKLEYEILDCSYSKEYGLTRLEREKKQFVSDEIDYLYIQNSELFSKIYFECFGQFENSLELMYEKIIKKIEKGYSFIHEVLYKELIRR